MKKILVLGDSITYGHGCSDRMYYWDYQAGHYVGDCTTFTSPSVHCWAQHIHNQPNYAVTNLSQSGNNNTNMAWQAVQAVKDSPHKFDHIIAAFSYDDRIEFAHPDYDVLISASPLAPPQLHLNRYPAWDQAVHLYREQLYHPDWGIKLTHIAIGAVANLAREIGAVFHWSLPEFNQTESSSMLSDAIRSVQIPSMIKHFGLWQHGSMLSSKESPYCAVDGHPSELAHREYFDQVIQRLL